MNAHPVQSAVIPEWDAVPRLRPLAAPLRVLLPDLVALALITSLAAFLRLYRLDAIPFGLHGDEAWTGLDARRVLREGWIGPYVGSAMGQPTGPLYWAAIVVKTFGDGVYQVRMSMAILGIVTIPLTYGAGSLLFDRRVGLLAATLLALSEWHLHFSRLGFMVISWPMMEMASLVLVWWALRAGSCWRWGLAGVALGAGVYTYNAYWLFPAGLALVLLVEAIRRPGWDRLRQLARLAGAAAAALLVALPLLLYIQNPKNDYWAHNRLVSVFKDPKYEQRDTAGKIRYLADKAGDYVTAMTWAPAPDGVDGGGSRAVLDRATLALLLPGILIAAWRWRNPAYLLLLVMLLAIPAGAVLTVNGMLRRTLGLAPFLAMLAALPLGWVWSRSRQLPGEWRHLGSVLVAIPILVAGASNVDHYFGTFPETPLVRFTFAEELALASDWIAGLPPDTEVLFYSNRWSYNYETRRYLAPGVPGADRSREFGGTAKVRNQLDPDPAWEGGIAYVFLGPYMGQAGPVQAHYPGGRLVQARDRYGQIAFVGYYLTPEALAAGQPFEPEPP